jgi:hypothetical protein
MQRKKIFLASSAELVDHRRALELSIARKNDSWVDRGIYLDLVIWEDFLDTVSATRQQDEYNKAITTCDIFVMLYFTKVGKYTAEEFEVAYRQFKATGKPAIYTWRNDAPVKPSSIDASLGVFKARLDEIGHFGNQYETTDGLLHQFNLQLDKLANNGFIPLDGAATTTPAPSFTATVTGGGAVAQGTGAIAVGQGAVHIGGAHLGSINTGTQTTNTGGGGYFAGPVTVTNGNVVGRDHVTSGVTAPELAALFEPVRASFRHLPAEQQIDAVWHLASIQLEIAKGRSADDTVMSKLVDGLVGLVPGAVSAVTSAFASPLLAAVAGPVTKFVLGRLKAP